MTPLLRLIYHLPPSCFTPSKITPSQTVSIDEYVKGSEVLKYPEIFSPF